MGQKCLQLFICEKQFILVLLCIIYCLFSIWTANYNPIFTPPCAVGARMGFLQKSSHLICVCSMTTGLVLVPFYRSGNWESTLAWDDIRGTEWSSGSSECIRGPTTPLSHRAKIPALFSAWRRWKSVKRVRKHACSQCQTYGCPAWPGCLWRRSPPRFTSERLLLATGAVGLSLLLVLFCRN